MIRRPRVSWLPALVVAAALIAAPSAWAAPGSGHDAPSLWSSVEAWFQSLLVDWFGYDSENSGIENTYNAADDPSAPPSDDPALGAAGGDTSTTDAGHTGDPNGG